MAQTTWGNQGLPLGSSYGPCIGVNEIPQQIPQVHQPTFKVESAWASPASLPHNIKRERERDRPPQPARPYPPSAYGAEPYPYPPAHQSPPLMHQQQEHQPMGRPYHGQQFLGPSMDHSVGQQQPLISSFGPAGPSPSPPVMLNPNRRPGDWDCPACMGHNFASRSECFKCGFLKPGGVSRRPGDWWCGKCNGHNYAYRVDCFKCGADKAEGSSEPKINLNNAYGGRRAGDWDCPNCNAHCFASRMECFKCGEPKPVDLSTDD